MLQQVYAIKRLDRGRQGERLRDIFDENWKGWLIQWQIIWPGMCRRQAHTCTRVFTHTHTNALSVTSSKPPPESGKRPRRQVWFASRSRTGSGTVSNSGSAALPQILSVVVRRHVIDVNLVAFLGNGKENGCVKRSISERGPCTGRPGSSRGACGEEGSKIKSHKSVEMISIITYKTLLGIKDGVKVSASDYCCETAGI